MGIILLLPESGSAHFLKTDLFQKMRRHEAINTGVKPCGSFTRPAACVYLHAVERILADARAVTQLTAGGRGLIRGPSPFFAVRPVRQLRRLLELVAERIAIPEQAGGYGTVSAASSSASPGLNSSSAKKPACPVSCFWRSSASRSVPIWRMVHRSDRRVRIGFPFAIGRRGFPDDRLAAGCGSRPAAIVSAGPIYLLPLHSKTKGCPRQNRTAFSCPSRILVWKRSISAWKASPDSGPLPRKRKKRLSDHVCTTLRNTELRGCLSFS